MDKKEKKDKKRYEKPKILSMAGLKESLGKVCVAGGWGCDSCGAGGDANAATCGSGGSPAS
jgi:hypothetical protein